MRNRSVGQNIDGWCTKCKLILAHTIEAMVGERVSRVHCNTCGAQHAWRASQPGTTTRASASRASASGPRRVAVRAVDPAAEYDALIGKRDNGAARPYSVHDGFRLHDLVAHPTFGVGVVTEDRGDKIDVLFREGARTLAQKRQ